MKCCLRALRHLLQFILESIVSAHGEVLHFSNCPDGRDHVFYVLNYVYPAGALHYLVSQFHTMGTVTGSATHAGTKLATAAFIAVPSGLKWTPAASDAASCAAPASAESGPLDAFGGVSSLNGMDRLRDSTPRACSCEESRWCTLQAHKRQIGLDSARCGGRGRKELPCSPWYTQAMKAG